MKQVREGYKMTELGEIPVEWEISKIGDLATINRGASPRPIRDEKWFSSNSEYGWIRISDVTKSKKYLYETEQYLSPLGVEKSRIVRPGDLIMSICGTVGRPIILGINACIHDGFVVFNEVKKDKLDLTYMLYLLFSLEEYFKNQGQPGTQVNLNTSIVEKTVIALPSKEEQQKIAEILSTIDEQIENTEQSIEKTKELKKGLMQRLLTKGIGHTEFKQTELGEIPVEWEIVKLQELFDLVTRPIDMKDNQLYRLVTVKRRQGGIIEREKLFGKQIKVKSQYLIKADDFLISKRQIVHGACEVVRRDLEDSIVSNEYHTLRAKNKLDIEFFRWLSRTPLVMKYFLLSSIGVHIEKMLFKLDDWYKYKVMIPPIEEQQKIAAILSSVDEQIESYEQEKEKYLQLKKGLMQQLLTGKMRVTV